MFNKNNIYFKQVELLIKVIPFIDKYNCFAVKGGTAINLFLCSLPRLSVDIDLTYIPIKSRDKSFEEISSSLKNIGNDIEQKLKGSKVIYSYLNNTNCVIKLLVELNSVRIKIEVSPVQRGLVFPPVRLEINEEVSNILGYAEILIASEEDLYGGKICAALDRQHPRDLFDILYLLKNGNISRSIFQSFVVYLISHNRPAVELLNPIFKDLEQVFKKEFQGMTIDKVSLEDLIQTRIELIDKLRKCFTNIDKQFLISFHSANPKWELLNIPNIKEFPAVKWKLQNISKMEKKKQGEQLIKLRKFLDSLDD